MGPVSTLGRCGAPCEQGAPAVAFVTYGPSRDVDAPAYDEEICCIYVPPAPGTLGQVSSYMTVRQPPSPPRGRSPWHCRSWTATTAPRRFYTLRGRQHRHIPDERTSDSTSMSQKGRDQEDDVSLIPTLMLLAILTERS
jgi:hypothetical protein